LSVVRTILAILITISLTLAPGASAFAATDGRVAMPMDHAAMPSVDMPDDMSDCMKAMQSGASDSSKSHCKCCDTQNKCPDSATCMTKCCKVIGALKPTGKIITLTPIAYRQAEPAKPPEWLRPPPAPPPRT
jgi:hypothetical protein